MTKKRWIGLLVENEIGVLARVSGLFSGKAYNLNSLTVGTTEDTTISRMTICLISDDQTFEQVKKQLNRSVEVIRVIDLTDTAIYMKELMFVKIRKCSGEGETALTCMQEMFDIKIIDDTAAAMLFECVQTEERNNDLIHLLQKEFPNRVEVVRGGSVAIEGMDRSNR